MIVARHNTSEVLHSWTGTASRRPGFSGSIVVYNYGELGTKSLPRRLENSASSIVRERSLDLALGSEIDLPTTQPDQCLVLSTIL